MQLTARFIVLPTPEQEEALWKLSERCRLLYNFALSDRIKAFKKGDRLAYIDQQNALPEIKKRYPEYKIVHSKVLQMTLKHLDGGYRSYTALKRNGDARARPPRYKKKQEFTTMAYNQSGFTIKNNKVKLSHFYNCTELIFGIPNKYHFEKVYQIAISSRNGRYFLSILYESEEKEYYDNGKYLAIDVGISNIVTAVNSGGRKLQVKNRRPDRYWEKRVERIQSRKSHCMKGSRKYLKLHKHELWMRGKSANQLKDFQHKLSHKLVSNTKANTIIVGSLSPKEMSMNDHSINAKGLHRSLQNTGSIGRFIGFLQYKAELIGKRVVKINERGTTKSCCSCGKMHEMRLSDRIMRCDCGIEIDRDLNASINIMKRFLSQNALVAGLDAFVSKLRQTGLLNDNDSSALVEVPSGERFGYHYL